MFYDICFAVRDGYEDPFVGRARRLRAACDPSYATQCVSALALHSRFPGAPTRRCRVRLQRPYYLYINSYNK